MPAGRGRMIFIKAWSGQTVAAVAGRRLSEGLGRTVAQLDEGKSFGADCSAAVLVKAELSVQSESRDVVRTGTYGKNDALAPAQRFLQEQAADTSTLMVWVDHQRRDADLVGFVVGSDAQDAHDHVVIQRPEAKLVGDLDVFDCLIEFCEALGTQDCCLLRVGERQDGVHFTCNVRIAVIDWNDVNHAFGAP